MKNFYRILFNHDVASQEGSAFHSLYTFTNTLGYQVLLLTFEMVIFLIVIFTGITFVKGYMSNSPQDRSDTKDKLVRNAVITVATVTAVPIMVTLFKIFSWSA